MTYLSVKEAAKIAQKNERTVRRWIKANKIKTSEIRGRFHVDEMSLQQYLALKKKSHLPIKEKTKKNSDIIRKKEDVTSLNKMSELIQNNRLDNVKKIENEMSVYTKSDTDTNFQDKDERISYLEKILTNILKSKERDIPAKNDYLGQQEINKDDAVFHIKENQEYYLGLQTDIKNVSELDDVNMSVNKFSKSPNTSQVLNNDSVEMSIVNNNKMSDFSKSSTNQYIAKHGKDVMSDNFSSLSTKLDIPVDKYFDRYGKIDAENIFFGDYNKMSGQNRGHFLRTNFLSSIEKNLKENENNVIIDKNSSKKDAVHISAYATRLIQEKERVAAKYEQMNAFLENQIIAQNKELRSLKMLTESHGNNQAKIIDFLMAENKYSQKRMEKVESKYEIHENQTGTISQGSEVMLNNNNQDKSKKSMLNNSIICPEIWEKNKILAVGMAIGMILGLICVSLILVLTVLTI